MNAIKTIAFRKGSTVDESIPLAFEILFGDVEDCVYLRDRVAVDFKPDLGVCYAGRGVRVTRIGEVVHNSEEFR